MSKYEKRPNLWYNINIFIWEELDKMKVETRTEPLRIVRGSGKVPGVLFGKTINPESIQVDDHELKETLKQYGHTQTFNIRMGKKSHTVYIKEIQRDIVSPTIILNVKLQKVLKNDTIKADLPLNILGRHEVDKPGFALHIVGDTVLVEIGVGHGLSHLDLDISQLKVGESIRVKDLELPEGVILHDDPERVLVSLTEAHIIEEEEEEEEETEEKATKEEPEVIKQKHSE